MASLLGKALAVRNAGPPVPFTGGRPFGLTSLLQNADNAEAYLRAYGASGTVWQIVHLLSSNVAKPPWKLFRQAPIDGRRRFTTSDQGSDQRTEVIKHQALDVLNQPNPFCSRFALFESSQQYLELTGESAWVVQRDPRAVFPTGLWPVRPDRLDPVPDAVTFLAGWVYTAPNGIERVPLRTDEVIFAKYPNPTDPYRGLGPAQSVLADIDAARYAAEWNKNFFINGARPDGILQVDHALEEGEFTELMTQWREQHKGVARAHRVAVLEAGVSWVPVAVSAKDMDFANLRNVSRDLIREAWGVHKIMLGNSDDVNRANAQTGEEVFSNWSVAPRLDRWKDILNSQYLPLFGSAGDGVEFDYVYPLPQNREQDNAELLAKAQAAQFLVNAGYDPGDVTEVVGLPEMGTVPAPAPPAPAAGGPPALLPGDDSQDDGTQNRLRLRAGRDTRAKVVEQLAEDYPPNAMAWVHHASWSGPAKLPVSHIDPDMQWVGPADPGHVQDFVKLLKDGKKLKPVILVKTPKSSRLQLSDGHHRYLAYAAMEMPVRAFVGTVDQEHGGWEHMHRYQKRADGGGGGTQNRQRQMAAWNALAGAR